MQNRTDFHTGLIIIANARYTLTKSHNPHIVKDRRLPHSRSSRLLGRYLFWPPSFPALESVFGKISAALFCLQQSNIPSQTYLLIRINFIDFDPLQFRRKQRLSILFLRPKLAEENLQIFLGACRTKNLPLLSFMRPWS
jgi:hypothetical protein